MDKIIFIKETNLLTNEIVEHAIIDRGNEEYTSMPKSTYDEMIAAQSTPIDTEDE
jgi:hypothetical protein